MRPVPVCVLATVVAAASLSVRGSAQDKPGAKPAAPAPPVLHLAAGDAFELKETETVVVREQSRFTATTHWTFTATVRGVKDDGTVTILLTCDRFTADYKTDFKPEWKIPEAVYSIDSDHKPNAFVVGDGSGIAGLLQLSALGGRTMEADLARDGSIRATRDEIRPPSVADDRSDARKSADPRAEAMRFLVPLPAEMPRAGAVWKVERWFAPTPFDIQYRAVGPFSEAFRTKSVTDAALVCDLSVAPPPKPGKTKKEKKDAPSVGVTLSECTLTGTAEFDLVTGLCTSRREEITAVTSELFKDGATQPLAYSVKTETSCRRKAK
jgi:hypothetical protein